MNIIAIIPEQVPSINWQTWISIIIGILALVVSVLVAWLTTLRKAEVIGILSCLKFSKDNTTEVEPSLILQNTGARSIAIELIRLKFCFKNCVIHAYPVDKNKKEKQFIGIVLSKDQIWENTFKFYLNTDKLDMLREKCNLEEYGIVTIEIISQKKAKKESKWKEISSSSFNELIGWIIGSGSGSYDEPYYSDIYNEVEKK